MTASPDRHARTMLPIPDRPAPGLTTYDAKDPDTAFPPIEPLLPPEGAPNVLIVLVDDVGFGASSAFGGPCLTPIAERLAAGGLRYNRFHTTALCAPTRQALLTGRNHHSVGMGSITETATSAPGNSSLRPNTKAPLAMTLKLNGYSTAQFGKCHEVPVWQSSPMGPFDAWPSGGGGFEKFYGFIGGENNQWDPALYDGTTPVEPPATPEEGYHLTEDLADQAVGWIRQQKALMPDKPFFVYFSLGATHAPHHVPTEWAEKYVGQFDEGWDVARQRWFERQLATGVVPGGTELAPRNPGVDAWDELPIHQRLLACPDPVDLVVCAHRTCRIALLHRDLVGQVIHLAERPLVDVRAAQLAIDFLLIGEIVLDVGCDRLVLIAIFETAHIRGCHQASQKCVLPEIF